jgi:hypothetical protein
MPYLCPEGGDSIFLRNPGNHETTKCGNYDEKWKLYFVGYFVYDSNFFTLDQPLYTFCI